MVQQEFTPEIEVFNMLFEISLSIFSMASLKLPIQSFPSHHAERFFGFFFVSSPGLWAAIAASYCPSRPGELTKKI